MLADSIFPDQLGEFDWLLKNFGVARHSIFHENRLLIATDSSVVASVNVILGTIDWRMMIPSGSLIEDLVLDDQGQLLMYYVDNGTGIASVQCLDTFSGYVLWKVNLGLVALRDTRRSVEIQVNNARRILLVLARNSIYVLSTASGTLHWSWSPDQNSHIIIQSLSFPFDGKYVLASTPSNSSPVAVGCIASLTSNCSKSVLVFADYIKKQCSTHIYGSALGDLVDGSVRAIFSDSAQVSPNDLILGLLSTENAMKVLHLASTKLYYVSFPPSVLEKEKYVTHDVYLLNTLGSITPVISRCSSVLCEIFELQLNNNSSPSLIMRSNCSGSVGVFSIVERIPSYARAASKISCLSASKGATENCVSENCNAVLSIQTFVGEVLKLFNLTMSYTSFIEFRHASMQTLTMGRNNEVCFRGLIVTSAGSSIMIQANHISTAILQIWSREEALAHVSGAVLIDGIQVSEYVQELDLSLKNLLDIRSRLLFQLDEFNDGTKKLVSFAVGFPTAFYHTFIGYFERGDENDKLRSHSFFAKSSKAKARSLFRAQRFGFDKRAVCVSTGLSGPVLLGIDLISGAVAWILEIEGPMKNFSFVKLLSIKRNEVIFVVALDEGSYVFNIDAHSGALIKRGKSPIDTQTNRVIGRNEATFALPNHRVLSIFKSNKCHNEECQHFYLVVEDDNKERFVVLYSSSETKRNNIDDMFEYVYYLDESMGTLQTYRIDKAFLQGAFSFHRLFSVATAVFETNSERIVAIAHPTPDDPVNSQYTTLDDDSLLLKYLNPSIIMIASVSPAEAADNYYNPIDDENTSAIRMYLSLVDTVNARVIYRASLESASNPIYPILIENHIVVTYWNVKSKRCEVSFVALYQRMIDRYVLTPFASNRFMTISAALRNENISSFSVVDPLAVQKTFVLPKAVTAVGHTVTAEGIANKYLLLGLVNGQIYSLDTRQISSRSPITDISMTGRDEGLGVYHPFVQLLPLNAATHNYSMRRGPVGIVSAPARLESSTLVFSYGPPDIHFNRIIPSGGFDLLASDFNYALLTCLLFLLGSFVIGLKFFAMEKILEQLWANSHFLL